MEKQSYSTPVGGFYGEFGGAFVPEAVRGCLGELQDSYLGIIGSDGFRQEFRALLRDYVGRPTPLYFARRMSEKYGCRLYLKREDLNHTGAHKINNAIGQALIARRMGKRHVIAETGAGQHGVAVATACALLGMDCKIFMGKADVARQHANVERMRMLGAEVVAVAEGNMTLSHACTAAIRYWCGNPADTFYAVGSAVGPHPYPDLVARLQSVISEELKAQLAEKTGRDRPDCLIASVGGGSNAAGTVFHYADDERVRIVLAEAAGEGLDSGRTAATLHRGRPGVLHGSRILVIQTPDGLTDEAYTVSAGLDYPGVGPMHCNMAAAGRCEIVAVDDGEAIRAGYELTRLEGIIPAIESAHAVAALGKVKFNGGGDVVVLTVSGRGDKDVETYLRF